MRVLGLASLLTVGVIVGGAAAQETIPPLVVVAPADEEPSLIADPVWIVGPAEFDRAPFYPLELTAGEAAAVEVECGVLPSGYLGRCAPMGDPSVARPFMLASLRVMVNLRLSPPPAPAPPLTLDPAVPPPPVVVGPVARVRFVLDWAPPADLEATAARFAPALVIDLPDWQRGGSEYPERALSRGVESGRVQVMCTARATGRLEGCSALQEEPAGVGFGMAAVRTVRRKRVTPSTVDGQPIDDLIFAHVNFRLESTEEEAARREAAAAELSPVCLPLTFSPPARRSPPLSRFPVRRVPGS